MLKIALVDDNTDFLLLLRKKVHAFFDAEMFCARSDFSLTRRFFTLIWKKDFITISVFWT